MPDNVMETNQTAPTKSSSNWLAILISVLSFCAVLAAMSFGYFQWLETKAVMNSNLTNLENQTSDANKQITALSNTINDLQKVVEQTQKETMREAKAAEQDKAAAELYARLAQLHQQIDQLPLPAMQGTKTDIVPAPSPELSWWRAGLQRGLAGLSKIVTVKYIGTDVPPLVTPDAKQYLYQNLHAEVDNAMWAALHHQPAVYQQSLANMSTWIKRYFANDAATTQLLLQEVDALTKVTVQG